MKFNLILVLPVIIFIVGCENRSARTGRIESNINASKQSHADSPDSVPAPTKPAHIEKELAKAVFYLENSGSMFGYVNGFSEYVDVVSELAEKPRFADEKTPREFYFINGGSDVTITDIGESPAALKDKLNINGFNVGDVTKSNLNSMFQIALNKAKSDTISILISDGIYDIGSSQAPMNALSTEGRETRSRFIERLNKGNFQTLIVKMESHFNGYYYPATTGGQIELNQKRPYYLWVFGHTKLLNEYFPTDYLKDLEGYQDLARFIKSDQIKTPYSITTHDKMGDFRMDNNNEHTLTNIKKDIRGQGFQFTIAVDFSHLPFSDSYLMDTANYSCNNESYTVKEVKRKGNIKLYGLGFEPSHLLAIYTSGNPLGNLEISLKNTVPNWINETSTDAEENIIGDTEHTFGFSFLTEAISDAYNYKTKDKAITTFKVQLTKEKSRSYYWTWIIAIITAFFIGIILFNKINN